MTSLPVQILDVVFETMVIIKFMQLFMQVVSCMKFVHLLGISID